MSLSEPFLARSIFGKRRLAGHFRRLARKQKLAFVDPPASLDDAEFLNYLELLATRNRISTLIIKETFREGKEWDNVALLNWIAATGRPVLGITRHPYDAAVSTLRFCRWWRGIVGRLARLWIPRLPLFANDEILMEYFAANWSGFARWASSQDIAIWRYEDLVKNPEATIKHCCAAAGLQFCPEMIDSNAPRLAFGGIGAPEVINRKPKSIHARSVGRKSQLPPRLAEIVRAGCEAAACQLDYEL